MNRLTRVLLVDDSVLARRLIARLSGVDGLEIVGEASDPYIARDRIVELEPDVVVLDLEMPRMDGIAFLKRLIQHHPLPVVVCSSASERGGELALKALAAGALAVVSKPCERHAEQEMARELAAAVLAAARVARPVVAARFSPTHPPGTSLRPTRAPTVVPRAATPRLREVRAIGIGAGTGGTVAIESIVRKLPGDSPPVLIVQQLPAYVVPAFAKRLAVHTQLRVEVASDGAELRAGLLLVAPAGRQLGVERAGNELRLQLSRPGEPNRAPSAIDALFDTLARSARSNAIGVLLTGAGNDGAEGLLALRSAGARTLVQDEASSVVWDMPKAALERGAAEDVLPLERIAGRINQLTQRSPALSLPPEA